MAYQIAIKSGIPLRLRLDEATHRTKSRQKHQKQSPFPVRCPHKNTELHNYAEGLGSPVQAPWLLVCLREPENRFVESKPEMAKALTATLNDLISSQGPTWWKRRINSCQLSADRHQTNAIRQTKQI